jgi:addiction module HigA family antidote
MLRMLPKHRPPTHPGEMLLKEFLEPQSISQTELAAKLGVPIQRINGLINGRRAVTAETAILLARVFGNSPRFWLTLQADWDLWHAQKKMKASGRKAR